MDATSSDIRRLNKTKNDVFILIKIRHFQPGKTAHSYFALTQPLPPVDFIFLLCYIFSGEKKKGARGVIEFDLEIAR